MARENFSTKLLLPEYMAKSGKVYKADPDDILTIVPRFRCIIPGNTMRVMYTTESIFMVNSVVTSSSVNS